MEGPKKPENDESRFVETRKLWRQLSFALIGILLPFSGYAAFQVFEIFNAVRETDLAFTKLEREAARITRQADAREKVWAAYKNSVDRFVKCPPPFSSLLPKHLLENQKQNWKRTLSSCSSKSIDDLGGITAYKSDDYPLIKPLAEAVAELLTAEKRIWDELDVYIESNEVAGKQLDTFMAQIDSFSPASAPIKGRLEQVRGKIADAYSEVQLEMKGALTKLDSAKQKFMLYLTGLIVSGIVLAWSVFQIIRPREFQQKKPKLILPE